MYDGESTETIFEEREYRDVFSNIEEDKYGFFKKIINHYEVKDPKEIIDRFSYIFNFILVNNITNYIIDKYWKGDFGEIVFDEKIKDIKKTSIKLSGIIDVEDAIGDIITCFINSDAYLNGEIKIDYGRIDKKDIDLTFDNKGIDFFFRYTADAVDVFIKELEIDLVAFKFVEKEDKNEEGRYTLPIYVDHETLVSKGIEDYEDFLVNWTSLAYLHMLSVIHDYFVDYYFITTEKGLVNDNLMLGLISLLDADIKPYPQGLKKSLEVGRATKGKCYFIDGIVPPLSISQDLALVFQGKDVFSVVPKVFKNRLG